MRKRKHLAAWCLVVTFGIASAYGGQSSALETVSDQSLATETQLRNLEEEWSAAFVRADIPVLERILGREFALTDARGRVTDKSEEIASAREGGLLSNTVSDLVIRVYGTTAIVTGRLTLVLQAQPGERLSYRITDV